MEEVQNQSIEKDGKEAKVEQKIDGSLKKLIENKRHRQNLLVFIGLWVVGTFNTYLIFFQIKYLKGDFFVNTLVSAASDIVAYTIAGLLIERLGIKVSYICSFLICLVGAIMYLALRNEHPHFIPVFLLISNFGNSWSLNVDWNSNALLFPVIFASSTNGICNLFARLSNILAPQFAELEQPLPILIFAGMSSIGVILSIFLLPPKYLSQTRKEDNSPLLLKDSHHHHHIELADNSNSHV